MSGPNAFEIIMADRLSVHRSGCMLSGNGFYYFSINQATDFILSCLPLINEGEIFISKMKLYTILELAKKISKKYKIIGKREGEKILELLITDEELKKAKKTKDMWIINPS